MNSFDEYLASLIENDSVVHEAMNYSLLAKSKRIRPLILLSLLKDFGIEEQKGYACAAAIEMIHTYSLIHDDLPCFDNDDFRRGQPTSHKKYGEATAVLAGDALLTDAFGVLCSGTYSDAQKAKMVSLFVKYAGSKGMIEGQSLDMQYEGKEVSIKEQWNMDTLKTGCLMSLPMQCALVIADKENLSDLFENIARDLGMSFQIQDDILDVTSSKEKLGKSSSDVANEKSTYVSLMGMDGAADKVKEFFINIYSLLGNDYPAFRELVERVEKRTW